jgi:hypothetical protein
MDIKEKQCIEGFQVTPMNLMHISLDLSVRKVFKTQGKGLHAPGLAFVIRGVLLGSADIKIKTVVGLRIRGGWYPFFQNLFFFFLL